MKKDTNTLITSIILLLVIYYVYTLLIYQNENRKKCVKYFYQKYSTNKVNNSNESFYNTGLPPTTTQPPKEKNKIRITIQGKELLPSKISNLENEVKAILNLKAVKAKINSFVTPPVTTTIEGGGDQIYKTFEKDIIDEFFNNCIKHLRYRPTEKTIEKIFGSTELVLEPKYEIYLDLVDLEKDYEEMGTKKKTIYDNIIKDLMDYIGSANVLGNKIIIDKIKEDEKPKATDYKKIELQFLDEDNFPKKYTNDPFCRGSCTSLPNMSDSSDIDKDIIDKCNGKLKGKVEGKNFNYNCNSVCDPNWKNFYDSPEQYAKFNDGVLPCQVDSDCSGCDSTSPNHLNTGAKSKDFIFSPEQYQKLIKNQQTNADVADESSNLYTQDSQYAEYSPYLFGSGTFSISNMDKLFDQEKLDELKDGQTIELTDNMNRVLKYKLGEHILEVHNKQKKKPMIIQQNTTGDTNIFSPHIYVKKKPNDFNSDYYNPKGEFR